jgi:hypothetical protein
VADYRAEGSLVLFLLLNTAVFGSAYLFARRWMTPSRSQAMLDALLIGYVIQYLAVGMPGLLGCVQPIPVYITAGIFVAILLITALFPGRFLRYPQEPDRTPNDSDRAVIGIALFVISFVVLFVHTRADAPVLSNDAMTYHFPAAVQWLQQGKIDLFQTWFFNPANTYSPLAGSIFIAWLMIPFSSDVLAKFVEVPALLCAGLATYRLCLQIGEPGRVGQVHIRNGTPRLSAAMLAAAAVFARPIFQPALMGKDDLFVAFFFIASLVALSPERSKEKWSALRFGLSLGLLLATKYTALLCAPLLLLAIDAPCWCARRWIGAIAIALALAGPWYLRNWITTGNPLFPLDIPHLIHGLFTTSRSDAFASFRSAFRVAVGGSYGMPVALAVLLAFSWVACCALRWRDIRSQPILRACILGSAIGIAIFYWRSPFPEVRFLLPIFLMLFACLAAAIGSICRQQKAVVAIAALILAVALATVLAPAFWRVDLMLCVFSLAISVAVLWIRWWAGNWRLRWISACALCGIAFCIFTYINWAAYTLGQSPDVYYSIEYPEHAPLWRAVNEQIPANATVAYTNLYLIYPMMGRSLSRRLVYAPTRPGVSSIADLGWLGNSLSGEQLIPAAVRATVAAANKSTWTENLRKSKAEYLVIGRGGVINVPPEAAFVAGDQHFQLMFAGPAGWLYRIERKR